MTAVNDQKSILTCPNCGEQTTEIMPGDACVYFWECPHCEKILKPEQNDCCVFCTYGSVPCPPVQNDRGDD